MHNPIILALDYYAYEQAEEMLVLASPYIGMMKIGLQLFSAEGQHAFSLGRRYRKPIFLDLKLNDIPTTVSKTVGVLCRGLSKVSGVHYLSVHCNGGEEMCNAAIDAAKHSNVRIVGITSLTSLDENHYKQIGMIDPNVDAVAISLVRAAGGITRFVCPPNQLQLMRAAFGNEIKLISPGIRLADGKKEDHANPATPDAAIASGANWIVVGRPITQAENVVDTAKEFLRLVGQK